MASSEPTPQNRFSGVSVLSVWTWVFRSLQNFSFRSCWWGSGYLFRPRKSMSVLSLVRPLTAVPVLVPLPLSARPGPYAFSLASSRMLVPSSL